MAIIRSFPGAAPEPAACPGPAAPGHGGPFADLAESADMPLAVLGSGLRVAQANSAFVGWLARDPAQVRHRPFPELVDPRLAEVLRARLIRVAQGRERRFRGTFTGLVPASGNAVTLVASIWRAPAPAILLIVLPEGAPVAGPAPGAGPISLTDLEARILQGVARGLSSADLASELYLSRQGIDYHVVRLQRRVKAKNRAELVSRAYTAGLLDPGNWPPRVLAARHAS